MTKLFFRVDRIGENVALTGPTVCLRASDQQSERALSKMSDGDIVSAVIKRPRHPKHHRKYWAMLGLVHEATAISDQFPTTQHLHDAIKGALGYYTTIKLPDGKEFHKLDSTAFENMGQTAFEDYYNRAVDVIVDQLVPHMDREDLVREVEGMLK